MSPVWGKKQISGGREGVGKLKILSFRNENHINSENARASPENIDRIRVFRFHFMLIITNGLMENFTYNVIVYLICSQFIKGLPIPE